MAIPADVASVLLHAAWRRTADVTPSVDRVRPFTMVARPSLVELANQVRFLLASNVPGDLVECGVWRGGASFLMADILQRAGDVGRSVWMFDSFEGLPPPADVDGAAANAWSTDTASPSFRDNLRISVDDVRRDARQLGVEERTQIVPGWFDRSLPANRERIGPIALLRIDADWHASVLCCLENLFELVTEGGLVVIDDYFTWQGCAVAVHEFLGKRGLGFPVEAPLGAGCGMPAVIRKADSTWYDTWRRIHELDEVHRTTDELARAVPVGATVLLVGEEVIDAGRVPDRRVIPFMEKEGQYWGMPADDAVAIGELERLRAAGASHVAFGASTFWWLEYYAGLREHLSATSRIVACSPRLIVFALNATR